MQSDQYRDHDVGRKAGLRARPLPAGLVRAALGLVLAALVLGFGPSIARAGDDDAAGDSPWSTVMRKLGLQQAPSAGSDINYTERSPLVVPPTRDLPPPQAAAAVPAPDWPKDPAKARKNAKPKPAVIPDTAVQTPNPPVVKKPWYDPMGWFDREEYANFAGEPVRQDLTDPPAGYRIPSPNEPYGIGPNKKPGKAQATASDFNMGSATPPPSQSGK